MINEFLSNYQSRIIIFIFSSMLLIAAATMMAVFSQDIKKSLYVCYYWIRIRVLRTIKRINFIVSLHTKLQDNSVVCLVFQTFVFAYEHDYKDIDTWGFSDKHFPRGKADITDMYRWIKKVRADNYKEFNGLSFDFSKNVLSYWGQTYSSFMYKINSAGELKIIPVIDKKTNKKQDRAMIFRFMHLKMFNDLYDLDNQKAQWIIERRNALMLSTTTR